MKTKESWHRHLIELVSTRLDPTVYAVQWAHDPRCMQRGVGHRRVGSNVNVSICRLWAGKSVKDWT